MQFLKTNNNNKLVITKKTRELANQNAIQAQHWIEITFK